MLNDWARLVSTMLLEAGVLHSNVGRAKHNPPKEEPKGGQSRMSLTNFALAGRVTAKEHPISIGEESGAA
jgi:hypothetical protein